MVENFLDHAFSMGKEGIITGWRPAVFALLAGGPAVFLAVVSQDTPTIVFGIATGTFACGWAFLNYGSALVLKSMQRRLEEAERQNQALLRQAAFDRAQLIELEAGSSDEVKVIREARTRLPGTGTDG